jgi:hypothetical protein
MESAKLSLDAGSDLVGDVGVAEHKSPAEGDPEIGISPTVVEIRWGG